MKKFQHKLQSNNHSVFEMHYHLIMVIKYRRKVIDEPISRRLKEIFAYIGKEYKISVEAWNHDIDHVHVLFAAEPKSELSKFINAYKSASSRLIKREFPSVRSFLWKEAFWSKSFCLLTTGGVTTEVIEQYIASQGEKEHNG
ncbi:MAG: IS200/IS605 family transposase [Lachnospiraceae bacterium]|nr:IS200/IS605 family transposase [Lachnospiraceae bacterium]